MPSKKRAENLETVRLTLEILRRIPRNRYISAKELHEQLQDINLSRDIRSVQRQLEMLCKHFGVERRIGGGAHGFRWKENAQALVLPKLSEQESLLLNLAEQQLKPLLPARLMNSLSSFFDQARYNLDTTSESAAREWRKKVRVVSANQPLMPPAISPEVFDAVSYGLYNNLLLNIQYKKDSGGPAVTYNEIRPLGLVQQTVALYLVCRFKGHDDNRILALHRIKKAEATFAFERPDFSLAQYCEDGAFAFGDGKKIRLTFDIEKNAGKHLLEMKLSDDQVVEESAVDADRFYRISATVVETERLKWWLRGFGKSVKNVTPLVID